MSAIQKRPDIFIIVCVGAYLLSENGHKPQVKAIFTALECLVFFYILKNVIYPSKNFYKNWVEKLNKIKFREQKTNLFKFSKKIELISKEVGGMTVHTRNL